MVFEHNETLAGLYEGITKRIDPSSEQSTRQAPTLSNTDLSKDQDLLAEAYTLVEKTCKCAAKGGSCKCDGCKECKANQEDKKQLSPAQKKIAQAAPPPNKITGADFKALKKEGLNFKDMFASVMNESKKQEVVCGTKINPQFQYNCVMKDGTKTTLKGSSVLQKSDELKSVEAAHKKESLSR